MQVSLISGVDLSILESVYSLEDIKYLNEISYWSDSFYTAEHYQLGGVLLIEIEIYEDIQMGFKNDECVFPDDYTYGFIDVVMPKDGSTINNEQLYNARWFSISKKYLIQNVKTIKSMSWENFLRDDCWTELIEKKME